MKFLENGSRPQPPTSPVHSATKCGGECTDLFGESHLNFGASDLNIIGPKCTDPSFLYNQRSVHFSGSCEESAAAHWRLQIHKTCLAAKFVSTCPLPIMNRSDSIYIFVYVRIYMIHASIYTYLYNSRAHSCVFERVCVLFNVLYTIHAHINVCVYMCECLVLSEKCS